MNEKKIYLFVETSTLITKHELSKDNFDGNMGNYIAKIAHDYPADAKYYVGGLA